MALALAYVLLVVIFFMLAVVIAALHIVFDELSTVADWLRQSSAGRFRKQRQSMKPSELSRTMPVNSDGSH